jgi:hypothetical protein
MEDPVQVMDMVLRLNEDWKLVQERATSSSTRGLVEKWCPLDEGLGEGKRRWCNVESARLRSGERSYGTIMGRSLPGRANFFPSAADQEMAELLACRRAIRLAMEINVWKLFHETDSQSVVSKIKDKAKDFSLNGHLVNEMKSLLHS